MILGGALGWSIVFATGELWLLLVALVLTVAPLARLAPADPRLRRLIVISAGSCLILSWPLLWIPVGYVRYLITGEPIEGD